MKQETKEKLWNIGVPAALSIGFFWCIYGLAWFFEHKFWPAFALTWMVVFFFGFIAVTGAVGGTGSNKRRSIYMILQVVAAVGLVYSADLSFRASLLYTKIPAHPLWDYMIAAAKWYGGGLIVSGIVWLFRRYAAITD